MAFKDDKTIRKKLDELHTLPAGYEPSLDSKWSVLEAGLAPEKKRFLIGWRSLAAAVILLFGGATLLIKQQPPSNKPHTPLAVQPVLTPTVKEAPAIPETKLTQMVNPVSQHKKHIQPALRVQPTTGDSDVLPAAKPEEPVLLANEPAKKPRFTELDFDEDPLAKPAEPAIAAQQFRFKLGHSGMSATGTPGKAKVRFSTSF